MLFEVVYGDFIHLFAGFDDGFEIEEGSDPLSNTDYPSGVYKGGGCASTGTQSRGWLNIFGLFMGLIWFNRRKQI